MELELTSLDTLKVYAQGQLVELPPFAANQPFVAKLKRPSLLALTKVGKIPNELLTNATQLFENPSGKEGYDQESVAKMYGILETICEASFVSPTYKELKELGIELNDEQMLFVLSYAQRGVSALRDFRTE